MTRPSDELPLEIDDGGAAPGDRVVPPGKHPWAPSVIESFSEEGAVSKFKTVYAITSGEYSDYHVLCLALTRGAAEAVVERINRLNSDDWMRGPEIQEMMLVDETVERKMVYSRSVEIWDDGLAGRPNEWDRAQWPWEMSVREDKPVSWRWVRAPYIEHIGGRLDVVGTDRERVTKVFSDTAAALRDNEAMRQQREILG